jgi:signal transduction histidine kinase
MYPSFKIKKQLQEGIMAYGNEERIEQVLMNLINNAAKYSGDKKEIIVRAEKNTDSAMVSVIDFGIGMVNSDQELIFERFIGPMDMNLQCRASVWDFIFHLRS